MELYTFFVFLSVIVMPDVIECPAADVVTQMHQSKMDSGEIVDWSATCMTTQLPLTIPQGLKT